MHRRKCYKLISILCLTVLLLLSAGPGAAGAAGTISVFGQDTAPGNNVDLGFLTIEVPPGALHNGDAFALTLPGRLSFNTSLPVAVGSDLGALTPSTVNVVYPPGVSGKANAITGGLTAGYSGPGTLRVALDGEPAAANTAFLYVYLKGINVPPDYRGDVKISIASNSGWPTTGEQVDNNDQNAARPAVPEPASPVIKAVFKIGETSFTLNGGTVQMDAAPFIKNDRTYVPVRYVARAAGVPDENISFENGVVTIKRGKNSVILAPGSNTVTVDGKPLQMDVPVLIVNGRAFAPLRRVCEAFYLKVTWDEKSQAVIVQSN